ncbi:7SK snRNA methylphosphate capping enzyme [Myripristis murdjan]|uniref:RNA methyltransferase n=1 Tax=Myripristis murdjan TaxID=586833 RepID=A0A667ZH01_9TELE|nr:7SK snRNA methylphosphate capping enzyme-like [Myripristis murdjan]XP_029932215.1 7SK snRNA methylphosphate capping enzyme-like [Myripristis murdjan]
MIKMSLDKDVAVVGDRTLQEVPIKVSPAFPAPVSLSEETKLVKTRPLRPKNGIQPSNNGQAPPTVPSQRISKRRYSMGVGFKGLAKRRRRVNSDSQSEPVLPSHFLLGGNIFDPLNLNSLMDEDVNRATNQETPKCSPLPSRGGDPVEILVPRDITDPLNLKGGGEEGVEGGGVLLSPLKSRRRHRNRHHGGGACAGEGPERTRGVAGAEGGGGGGAEREVNPARLFPSRTTVPLLTREGSVPASPLPCELNTAITCRDDIAPPPILPRRHTHPPSSHAQKPRSQGDSRQRRRRRTTSTRSSEGATSADAPAVSAQPTRFQTPLVGGARLSRSGGPQPGSAHTPARKKKDRHRYQYGNHSRYYGYHGFYGDGWEGRVGAEEDPRLRLLKDDWFRHKKALDIGCGAGHVTLAIARRFGPAHILGVDRDERLVHAARQNVRHFLSHDLVVEERRGRGRGEEEGGAAEEREKAGERKTEEEEVKEEEVMKKEEEVKEEEEAMEAAVQQVVSLLSLPLSFRVSRGPLCAPPLLLPAGSAFPNNITFIQGDYVSEREAWPGRGQYDVVMCLGVTKWVQLQSGDEGVARLFRRAYQSLSPGGLFLLEPQPWSSYSRSKRASETTYRNYRNLRLRPEKFTSYLTEKIGFTSYRLLTHTGNQRPVYLFHKGSTSRK